MLLLETGIFHWILGRDVIGFLRSEHLRPLLPIRHLHDYVSIPLFIRGSPLAKPNHALMTDNLMRPY